MTTQTLQAQAMAGPSALVAAWRTIPGASTVRLEDATSHGEVFAAGEQAARLAVGTLLPEDARSARPPVMSASSIRFIAPAVEGPLQVHARVVGDPRALGRRIADEGAALLSVEVQVVSDRREAVAEMRTEWVVRSI
jgi:acyl-coenzyme A thioesterase PaaI-like protein